MKVLIDRGEFAYAVSSAFLCGVTLALIIVCWIVRIAELAK